MILHIKHINLFEQVQLTRQYILELYYYIIKQILTHSS